jgi:EAL domain-containing protein (putative c-di-GMP-specific phosphodiesterase class I)
MHPLDPVALVERWQIEMSAPLRVFDNRFALPVVTVDPLGYGVLGHAETGFHYPVELERRGVRGVQLLPPQYGLQWRMAYERDMALAVAFEQALDQSGATLAFQSVVNCDQPATVLYAEGLLRVSGLPDDVGAGHLVPVMEQLGLIRMLDRVVVQAVLDQLIDRPGAHLACNVSARSLIDDSWWISVFDRLSTRPDIASRLTIEITETAPVSDFEAAVAFVQRLKSLGCRIALDDFGSGHSTLAFARAIRPDVIKLDGRLLHGARRSEDEVCYFRRLVSLCKSLAPLVVAEGVESENDLQIAIEASVEWMQGTLIEPPLVCGPAAILRSREASQDNDR